MIFLIITAVTVIAALYYFQLPDLKDLDSL
jgi:hypothetical protein